LDLHIANAALFNALFPFSPIFARYTDLSKRWHVIFTTHPVSARWPDTDTPEVEFYNYANFTTCKLCIWCWNQE